MPTHWNAVSIRVRRAHSSVPWIWPQDREVIADHKKSSFSVSGVMGHRPGWSRWTSGRGKRKALVTTWVGSEDFLFPRPFFQVWK